MADNNDTSGNENQDDSSSNTENQIGGKTDPSSSGKNDFFSDNIIWIILGVIILGVLLYLFYNNQKNKSPIQSNLSQNQFPYNASEIQMI